MTILLAGGGTGGHVFPLIAVADAIKALEPRAKVVFVGTERGLEQRVVQARGYPLELMRISPMRGGGVTGFVRGASRAALAIPASRALLQRHQARTVCSIGGYAAGPVSLLARTQRIPLTLIEPNTVMGLTNRLIAPFVVRAYTHFAETEKHFKKGVVRCTGVPLRSGFSARPYGQRSGPLSILILGGSQGAKALNEIVPQALSRLETEARIVHQAGRERDAQVRDLYARLALSHAEVVPFIEDMPQALAAAELVIGRAGASSLAEICAVGRPSLLVPFPFAAGDHQLHNAEALAKQGAALCIPEPQASAERIAREINWLLHGERLAAMAASATTLGRPNAAFEVARELLEFAGYSSDSSTRSVA